MCTGRTVFQTMLRGSPCAGLARDGEGRPAITKRRNRHAVPCAREGACQCARRARAKEVAWRNSAAGSSASVGKTRASCVRRVCPGKMCSCLVRERRVRVTGQGGPRAGARTTGWIVRKPMTRAAGEYFSENRRVLNCDPGTPHRSLFVGKSRKSRYFSKR